MKIRDHEKAKILIVEDEVIIALQLEEKLGSLGYQVTSIVNNGIGRSIHSM